MTDVISNTPRRPFRIPIWSLMLLIAVLAVLFAGTGIVRNSKAQEKINHFANLERAYFQESGNDYQLAYDSVRSGGVAAAKEGREFALKADYERQLALYYGSLVRKYQGSLGKPWTRPSPDPPEPRPEALPPSTTP